MAEFPTDEELEAAQQLEHSFEVVFARQRIRDMRAERRAEFSAKHAGTFAAYAEMASEEDGRILEILTLISDGEEGVVDKAQKDVDDEERFNNG